MQEQAASDALSGWPNRLESGFSFLSLLPGAFATATIRRRSDLHGLHDSHVSGRIVIDHLAGHCQARLIRGCRRRVDDGCPVRIECKLAGDRISWQSNSS